jgi:hypothetical protein
MRSYVREFVRSLVCHQVRRYRKGISKGVIGLRLSVADKEILQAVATKWNMPVTSMAELLLAEAVKDAANEVGLWYPDPESNEKEPAAEE